MAQRVINIGGNANDGSGDSLRVAFTKANQNFAELYANDAMGYTGSGTGGNGYTGSRGVTGNTGFTGSRGFIGFTGYTGSTGVDGYVGSTGYSGSSGFVGSRGFTGSTGAGYTGSASTQIGYTGSSVIGYTGSSILGYTGSASTELGYTGSAGMTTNLSPETYGAVGDGTTDDLAAWNALISHVGDLNDLGSYSSIHIDGGGKVYALSDTLTFGNKTDNVIVTNCKFIPLGNTSNWTESDTFIITYFRNYQTYGTSWITQKPLIAIGEFNPGFVIRDVNIDCLRVCAGIYVSGNSKGRLLNNVGIDNVCSYGINMVESIKLDTVKIRINTDPAGDRDAYGIAYAATDTHWKSVTIQWGHCPLLTTGATLMMVDCDLFNGSNDSLSPITNPRLWEHRGNTITWLGGRLGNGVVHVWNTDLTIHPSKIGITNTAQITDYFKFYSTGTNQTVDNFSYYPSEIPAEIRTGSTNLFGFVNPTTFTANRTNGSNVLTSVSSVANLNIGQAIVGSGIAPGATITAINSNTMTITMSANATSTGNTGTVTPTGSWDTNTVSNMAGTQGYYMIIPRGLNFAATEGNNVYPLSINNAPGVDDSLIRFRAGGTTSVPEVGLRNDKAYLGYNNTVGISVDSVGLVTVPALQVSGTSTFDDAVFLPQATHTTKSTTATLLATELITGILQYTGGTGTITIPTGSDIENVTTWAKNNISLDWYVINTGTTGICTIGANSNTVVGSLEVAARTSAHFRIRRTGSQAFTIYRLS